MRKFDVCVIGSGMAGLTAACLLAKDGVKVGVLEQNWLPGGCVSSYSRKGFVFESGATTLVGLDQHMPLRFLLEETGININPLHLKLPMQVWLPDGTLVNRYEPLEKWIAEAERVFGKQSQRAFWEFCYKVSEFVWETSLKQTAFPPSNASDLLFAMGNASLKQFKFARYALTSMKSLLKSFKLDKHKEFVRFVNEQLMITAQNRMEEVNVLFGATALCYTNYGNYYMNGGLINLINPLVDFIKVNGGEVLLRTGVESIERENGHYTIQAKHKTEKEEFSCGYLISAIPINNTLEVFRSKPRKVFEEKQMGSERLNSAFQLGIGFNTDKTFDAIHHQIHLKTPLAECGTDSIFLSLNHPSDTSRTEATGQCVASVSTHLHDPERNYIKDIEAVESAIVDKLESLGFLTRKDIVYQHSATPKTWKKWTGRAFGFVGGYPQFMKIKPWQMLDARLDGDKAYICGDTTYPGQGIPGATLSGIIAYEKMKRDHF
ncbi:NAD(P)/FAD-dependent oxidoreductase [Limibacter armeniacum]|uniref:phytoene desaturase family protein n=1 Tax=Limibacter armeniacum TaxID=466084 RepID=UPI002FE53D4E